MKNLFFLYFFKKIFLYFILFLSFYFFESFSFIFSFYKEFKRDFEKRSGFLIHFKYFFVPLWNIYSFYGYLLSIPIRLTKIIIGLIVHSFVLIFLFLIYSLWLILPWSLLLNNFFKFYRI